LKPPLAAVNGTSCRDCHVVWWMTGDTVNDSPKSSCHTQVTVGFVFSVTSHTSEVSQLSPMWHQTPCTATEVSDCHKPTSWCDSDTMYFHNDMTTQ